MHETLPYLGFGLGLRPQHYEEILQQNPEVDWFEILSENYLIPGGRPLYYLDRIAERYPIVMHGVSLSLGSTDPLDYMYLEKLKVLSARTNAVWISDHLCWTGVHGINVHDLLPLPYTEETIQHLVNRIARVQEILERRILIENVSSYLSFERDEMPEWEFITTIANQADCYLLLDINNIYVSAINHGFDPLMYLDALPKKRIQQIHLAGHSLQGNYIIDTHDTAISHPVWLLYKEAIHRFGFISTMIERDDNIPSLQEMVAELTQARTITLHENIKTTTNTIATISS